MACVTGGGTGIGLMIASALENNGAKVFIVGRRYDSRSPMSQQSNLDRRKEVLDKAAQTYAVNSLLQEITARADIMKFNRNMEILYHYRVTLPPRIRYPP